MQIRIIWLVSVTLFANSCRTAEQRSPATASEPVVVDQKDKFISDLALDKTTSQKLYVRMIGVELKAGVEVPKDRLHSSAGTVECRKRGAAKNCQMRVRLFQEQLSSVQTLQSEVEATVWRYLASARPDLVEADQVLVDLLCDYVGKKSPPYDVEDVSCKLSHPRSVNEIILSGVAAQELSETLQEGEPFTNLKNTVRGTVLCTWLSEAGQSLCMVRPMVDELLSENIEKVSHQQSGSIGRELRRAYFDRYSVESAAAAVDSNEPPPSPPDEILGRVICVVDSTTYQTSGKRAYSCRVEL